MRGDEDECEREQQSRGSDERSAQQRRASVERPVADVERSPSEPENRRDRQIARRLLEVKPFEQVERAQHNEQQDRQLKRAQTPPIEVISADEEDGRDRDRQRVEHLQLLNRLDLQQQVATPARVRRQRRKEID